MADEDDDDDDVGFRFLGWVPIGPTCHVCSGEVDFSPAALLLTSHGLHDGVALSVAAQVCSCCIDTVDLNEWVQENDPWDEISAGFDVYCPDDTPAPVLLEVSRLEPRCIRCKLMPVDMVAMQEIINEGRSIFSTGALGHLCRACHNAVGDDLSSANPQGPPEDN